MTSKKQLFEDSEQWVNQYQRHHPKWKPRTRKTYIADAHRILLTNDCLPGEGYRQVWRYITDRIPQADSQFGGCVESRFRRKKSDCP